MIWAVFVLIAAAVLFLLIEPFFRTATKADHLDEEDYLAAQIADIERDRAAGLISDSEAEAASAEARRRLLAAHRAAEKKTPVKTGAGARLAGAMLIGVAPAAAFAIYIALGNPGAQDTDEGLRIAARNPGAAASARPLAETVAELEARLEKDPDNLDDLVLLAESYANLDRFEEAAAAFGRARALAPREAYLSAAEGEAIAMAAGGVVTAEARQAFARALDLDRQEPRALFYLALAAYQEGRREEALEMLVALERNAPPNAGWLPVVRSQIAMISSELGRPIPGLPSQDPQALEAETASGDAPYETWIALIDAYAASGDAEKAKDAAARAKERYANAPFVLQEIVQAEARIDAAGAARRGPTDEQVQAASGMTPEDRASMIEGMVSGLSARLEENPDDLEGWTMLARSYGVIGEPEKSAEAFARAIELAPDDLALRLGRAEALIRALDSQGNPIDEEAQAAVEAVAAKAPDHPFALYFLGLAAEQSGDKDAAREYWTRLLNAMPEDAPETAQVRRMIEAL
jgi:cytochrome c-type biogenesis protein CcmH